MVTNMAMMMMRSEDEKMLLDESQWKSEMVDDHVG